MRTVTTKIDISYEGNSLPIKDNKIDRDQVKIMCDEGQFNSNGHFDSEKLQRRLEKYLNLNFIANKIKRTILWEMQAPDGGKHWLFGEVHYNTLLSKFPKSSQLFVAIEQAAVFMPEVEKGYNHPNNTDDRTVSSLIEEKVRKREAKIVELDDRNTRKKYWEKWDRARNKNKNQSISEMLDECDIALQYCRTYLCGDLLGFTKLQKRHDPHFRIITDCRNKMWVKKVVKHCNKNERCLICCGVGHVIEDENSLVSLLKNEGYNFTRVD